MNKREFLTELRKALSFELPEELVEGNINYYSSYIDGEVRKGRGQEEVLQELGDPKLIARSISDAIKSGADGIPGTADDLSFTGEAYSEPAWRRGPEECGTVDENGRASCEEEESNSSSYGGWRRTGTGTYREGPGTGNSASDRRAPEGGRSEHGMPGGIRSFQYQSSGCLGCLGVLLVIGLVVSVISWFVGGVLALLSPILGPVCFVLLIMWILKGLDRRR